MQAGDVVAVEGFLYRIAAPDAAGHHLTTAGGVRLLVQEAGADIRAFGARLDDATDDTAAIQRMIDVFGHFRLPAGTARITDSLVVPATSRTLGSVWSGEGMERSRLRAVGLAGKPALRAASATAYYRLTMRDFGIVGDCATAIDFTVAEPFQLYSSTFENLWFSSTTGSCFVATNHFSTAWRNVHVSSQGGHGFDLEGDVATVLDNCYAHNFTVGSGKAGYRIRGNAVMIGCNGLDSGDVWGDFGGLASAGDGADRQYYVVLQGCNIEDFDKHAITLRFTGRLALDTVGFIAKATGSYETLIKGDVHGAAQWSLFERNSYVTTKGSTRSGASRLLHRSAPDMIDVSATTFPDLRRTDQALTYPTPSLATSNPAFQVYAHRFRSVDWDRAYGFVLQVPAVWTANASSMSVTSRNTLRTANTAATTLQSASGGELGQRLTLIVQDTNTTIQHNVGVAGRFLTTSGANITAVNGGVYEFVHNGTNWVQV